MGIHRPYHDERDPQIVQARKDGLTYRVIGEQWCLSIERVRQICAKALRAERREQIRRELASVPDRQNTDE